MCQWKLGSPSPSLWIQRFLVDEGTQIPLKAGHNRPASETPFKWRFTGVPMNAGLAAMCFFSGSVTVLLKTLYFCDFSEGVRTPCSPYGSAHEFIFVNVSMIFLYVCLSRFSNGRIQMGVVVVVAWNPHHFPHPPWKITCCYEFP